MIGRPFHESVDLALLGDVARTILARAQERLACAGGKFKIDEAKKNCTDSLDRAVLAGNCTLEDAMTVRREFKKAALERHFELNPLD